MHYRPEKMYVWKECTIVLFVTVKNVLKSRSDGELSTDIYISKNGTTWCIWILTTNTDKKSYVFYKFAHTLDYSALAAFNQIQHLPENVCMKRMYHQICCQKLIFLLKNWYPFLCTNPWIKMSHSNTGACFDI